MSSRFDDQFEKWGAPELDQQFGVSAILQRGGLQTAAFTVAFNLVEDERLELDQDLRTEVERRVWYPLKADLVFSGSSSTFQPRIGDVLVVGSQSHQVAPMDDLPAVDEHPGGLRWILRTVRIN